MKTILVFGEEPTDKYFIDGKALIEGEVQIKYFTTRQMQADLYRIMGYQPDLIVNLVEPSEELSFQQKIRSACKDAPIINLY